MYECLNLADQTTFVQIFLTNKQARIQQMFQYICDFYSTHKHLQDNSPKSTESQSIARLLGSVPVDLQHKNQLQLFTKFFFFVCLNSRNRAACIPDG